MAIIELKPESISAIFAGDVSCPAASRYPFFPLNSPGMPPVGNSFVEHAAALGGDDSSQLSWYVSWLYLRALYEPGTFYMPIDVKGHSKQLRIVPGHLWGSEASGPISPKTSDDDHRPVVFIVGKAPGKEEVRDGRNLAGPAGNFLWHSFLEAGIPEDDLSCWYVTSLVRWFDPDFTGKGLPKHWIKDCLPLLHEELRLLRPDYVLCLGAESTRVLCGQSVENMVGRVLDLEIPLHESGEDPQIHTAKLMAVTHPQGVLRIPEKQPQFQKSICDFAALVKRETPKSAADDIRLQTVKTERELAEIVDKVLAQPGLKVIGLDAEWEGQKTPKDPGAYTRTIQFAPSDHYGVTVVLREAGGAPCFKPSIEAAVRQLNRLLDRDDVQIVGQFLAADIPWLDHEGVQIRKRYHAPKDFQQFRGGNYAGAFEVPIGFHAVNETEEFQLEMLAVRHVGAHRWDVVLDEYKTKYCKEHNIEESALDGYGNFDGEVLYPYGGYDAVFTRRLRTYLARPGGPLDSDRFGHDCWKPFHRAMRAYPALIEMHMMGVHVDRDRVDGITDIFLAGRSKKVEELRADINWPDFNTRSPQQCIEFLFGDKYATKIDKKTGQRVPVRPRDAVSLNMTPIKTSDKPVMPWQRVVDRHEEHLHSPSTDKEVCGNLGLVNKDALKLRDVRIVDQVLKSVMYPPTIVNGKYLLDAVGHRVYGGGISPFICYDDRVRSTFYPVTDTGRLSSSRPPLQNLSSKRESDYRRILAGLYRWPVRSFLTAGRLPDGRKTVLMEADFGGAELLMLGVMARDKVMIDHCLRGQLPEDDPNYYDIHSNVCVVAFKLDCPPTKSGLKSIGKKDLRVGAKATIFARNYGGGAETIARKIQEEGVLASVEDVQRMLDAIDEIYPDTVRYKNDAMARVLEPGWLASCFGRYRRFIPTNDPSVLGELQRKAANFGMQAGVADGMNEGLDNLYNHPRKEEIGYRIVLQIHDAALLEVPVEHVDEVYDKIMPECLTEKITFRSCDLDGIAYPDSPVYRFGIDRKVCYRWGEALTWKECDALGVDTRYGYNPKSN